MYLTKRPPHRSGLSSSFRGHRYVLLCCHLAFDIFCRDGKALGTEQTAALFGYENIILETDAAEVVVLFLKKGEIDILGIDAFLLPLLDEGRDKINSGLIGYDVTGLEHLAHTEGAETELGGALVGVVIAYIILAESSISCTSRPMLWPRP